MPTEPRKDGTPSRNPVRTQSLRVGKTSPKLGRVTQGCPSSSEVDDVESCVYSFELGVTMLLQDQPCTPAILGGFRRVINSVGSSGLWLEFVDDCSSLRSELVQIGDFELAVSKQQHRRWVRGLANAIRHAFPGNRILHPSPTFNRVATFLGWMKRLPAFIRDERESVDAYFASDRRLSSVSFDDNEYVAPLSAIWKEWFGNFRLTEPFAPRHGSGSTADAGRTLHDKWTRLRIDKTARILLHSDSLLKWWDEDDKALDRTSKVVFVPKQFGKDRTICMEPATLQYLQQGVAQQWVTFSHDPRHPVSRLVDIFSQEKNRDLCGAAYVEGLSTIDLSDASDSVSYRLIKALCGGLPLFRYLHATRSFETTVGGYKVRMDKFAPMGSALCFPTECYVFASVVELAYRMHFGKTGSGTHSGCSVYGDDIICPREIYHLVVEILESLGFIVNREKSFSSGGYYESCGVEYLYGAAIKSLKHPRSHLLCQEVVSPDRVGLVTDLANSLIEFGYFRARRQFLQDNCRKRVRVGAKFVPLQDLLVFGPTGIIPVDEPYVKKHWSFDYQCSVVTRWVCDSRLSPAGSDFIDAASRWRSRTREQRLSHLRRPIQDVVDDKWSRKAVIALSKFGFNELVRGDDIETVGSNRTGRLRQALRRKTIPGRIA